MTGATNNPKVNTAIGRQVPCPQADSLFVPLSLRRMTMVETLVATAVFGSLFYLVFLAKIF
jgi:hypothetical protein